MINIVEFNAKRVILSSIRSTAEMDLMDEKLDDVLTINVLTT